MLQDITIGQYYPTNSIIHRLDPRVKLLFTFIFMVSLFITNSFLSYIFIVAVLIGIISITKIPFSYIFRGIKAILFLLILTFILNVLFTQAGKIYFEYGLTDALEKALNPFKKVGLPAHEIAMMMTIALRFIPTLLDETDKIMKAQIARGADFESKNVLSRAKSMIPLLVPLFISAFRRADELAMAMESRCYHGGEGRTRLKELNYEKIDHIAIALILLFPIIVVAIGFIKLSF